MIALCAPRATFISYGIPARGGGSARGQRGEIDDAELRDAMLSRAEEFAGPADRKVALRELEAVELEVDLDPPPQPSESREEAVVLRDPDAVRVQDHPGDRPFRGRLDDLEHLGMDGRFPAGEHEDVDPPALARCGGWAVKPEGLCRGALCVPVPPGQAGQAPRPKGGAKGAPAAEPQAPGKRASVSGATPPRMRERFRSAVVPAMMKERGYGNPFQVPRLEKVVINMGVGEGKENAKVLDFATADLQAITGQCHLTAYPSRSRPRADWGQEYLRYRAPPDRE